MKKIYDRGTKEWFSVSEEDYREYDLWRTNLRKKKQRQGRCRCTKEKWWLCDGMCEECEFCCGEKEFSLDEPASDEEGNGCILPDLLTADGPGMEERIADRDLAEKLMDLMREMDPDADTIIALWVKDWQISDRKVAERLGRAQKTFSRQMRAYRDACRKYICE